MAVVGGTAARSDLPVQRGFASWGYEFQIARGAWDAWMESGDWLGLGRVVLAADHQMAADQVMAATDNGTLEFSLIDTDSYEYLAFTADLLADDDPDRTDYMTRMLAQLRSRRIGQTSVGCLLVEHRWDFPDDDNDLEQDRLTCLKASMAELSLVAFGAQGDEARAGIIAQALSRGSVVVDDLAARLTEGPMKLMEMGPDGEPTAFDARASRDAAYAEHLSKKNSTAETEEPKPVQGAAAQARDRIAARRIGG